MKQGRVHESLALAALAASCDDDIAAAQQAEDRRAERHEAYRLVREAAIETAVASSAGDASSVGLAPVVSLSARRAERVGRAGAAGGGGAAA